ncbi:MAG TPA: glycoside hydrolase, partial [Clostridia bacterium]|nr:glycoside hydrolase [Clostridia bacterium]
MTQNMEKLLPGVYRIRFGEPEKFSYAAFREYPMLPFGKDCSAPFAAEDVVFQTTARGCSLSLPLDAQVFGFGLQLKAFNHTRAMRVMRNNADAITPSGESHAPAPFYVTTQGYGVLVDSARDVAFYCGQSKLRGASRANPFEFTENLSASEAAYRRFLEKDRTEMLVDIPQAKGVDVYVFAGESMLEAVQKYNMFSGGGADLPEWALGVWYRM